MFSMRDVYPEYKLHETTEMTIPADQARKDPKMPEGVQRNDHWIWFGIVLIIVIIALLEYFRGGR